MIQPQDLDIPYNTWRPSQWDIISQAVLSDKKYILIEAPPGIGKSGIALAIARLLDVKTHYLTGTRQLQDQYAELPGLVTVKGRQNFPCLIQPSVNADQAMCLVDPCEYQGETGIAGCSYFDQKRTGIEAKESVWNYAYWLRQANFGKGFKNNEPELLVCDEAHTIKNHVRSFVTITIRRGTLAEWGMEPPPNPDLPFEAHQEWARDALFEAADNSKALNKSRSQKTGGVDTLFIKKHNRLESLLESLRTLRKQAGDWVVVENVYGWEYRPVWVDTFVRDELLRHAPKVVLMSATILDKDAFCSLHGMDVGQTEFIQAPSVFPKKSRPIRYWPHAIKQTEMGDVLNSIEAIVKQHEGERGLIHTVSYRLANQIVNALKSTRVMTHTNQDREIVLRDFRKTPGAILVSPSMTTGVDLPYDLCRFQIICKLPFPDLGDRQIKAAMKEVSCQTCSGTGLVYMNKCSDCRGKGFKTDRRGQLAYNYDTLTTLIQAYGRGMRAADDACITYLLDSNWRWFKPANKQMIPGWFTEAIQPYEIAEPSITDFLRSIQ